MRRRHRKPQSPGGETGKQLEKADLIRGEVECMVCGKSSPLLRMRRLCKTQDEIESGAKPNYLHDRSCGPGTKRWLKYTWAGQALSLYLWAQGSKKKKREGDTKRVKAYKAYLEENNMSPDTLLEGSQAISKFLDYEENSRRYKMGKDEDKKKKSNLPVKEPIELPSKLYKNKTIGELLDQLDEAEKSSDDARKIRKKLRDKGFKLSDKETWEHFMDKDGTSPDAKGSSKKKKKKKAKDEEEEEEEEETPKKKKKKKKAVEEEEEEEEKPKKKKKKKKKKVEEEEDDD